MKGVKYRTWNTNAVPPPIQKFKRPTEKEMTEVRAVKNESKFGSHLFPIRCITLVYRFQTLFRMNITVMPAKMPEDVRSCVFCHQIGDGVADGPSRYLLVFRSLEVTIRSASHKF